MSNYQIGMTLGSLADLAVYPVGPDSTFVIWPQVNVVGDGKTRGGGFPQCTWIFPALSQADVNWLNAFCPGQSAEVWIRTLTPDGTFQVYSAILHWPADPFQYYLGWGQYTKFPLTFTHLQEEGWS